jgi:CxxC motif-containing protein
MKENHEIVCILCPLGCHVQVESDHRNHIISVTGNQCKLGKKYAVDEHRFPARILTTTLITESRCRNLLPVKSNKPIPKGLLQACMDDLPRLRIRPPIKMGQVVVSNIANTGTDLIATDEMVE